MTPQQDNTTPEEVILLASRTGIHQPLSHYLAIQGHCSIVGSMRDNGDATLCPKPVEHQGMFPR
jgi:hypothetical protein